MEKMGWSEGDGLGRNRQGNADHVKLKANYTGRGLGADKLASYDSTWIGHHDDFADLLSALNKNKEQKPATEEEKEERAKKISLELSSKSLRRRIHYQKFTRAKDTSNYTEKDRSAVLGIGLSRTKNESPKKEEAVAKSPKKEEEAVDTSNSNTTVSTLSVAEYFAAKMAALKAKREQTESEAKVDIDVKLEETVVKEEVEEQETEEERKERKKKRKEMKRLRESMQYETPTESCEVKVEMVEEQEVVEDEEEERKRRKREKKLKRRQEREQAELEENAKRAKIEQNCTEDEVDTQTKKGKRKKDKRIVEDEEEVSVNRDDDNKKKKKKNKKHRQEDEE
ncbi:hypothetical protein Y032_0123g1125 [Ancylostoma ceylanicum]|uniref:G-patch domain-containing protein n=1 Tax=Ancylostoma ceylanicum TaxID=53326 RepID=A0A016T9B9_9BILA|nr:hypothetical protein Y032_0123g1125 [Ancylostoma ceylanicum]